MKHKRILKTCSWQLLGIVWFMGYALVTGGDLWYTFGLALARLGPISHELAALLEIRRPRRAFFRGDALDYVFIYWPILIYSYYLLAYSVTLAASPS